MFARLFRATASRGIGREHLPVQLRRLLVPAGAPAGGAQQVGEVAILRVAPRRLLEPRDRRAVGGRLHGGERGVEERVARGAQPQLERGDGRPHGDRRREEEADEHPLPGVEVGKDEREPPQGQPAPPLEGRHRQEEQQQEEAQRGGAVLGRAQPLLEVVAQEAAAPRDERQRDRPRDREGREQGGHRREVAAAAVPAPGRQEGGEAGDRGVDARDDSERPLLQQGDGEPRVPVRQPGREPDRGPEGSFRRLTVLRVELRHAALDETQAHGVEAQDVALHARAPDLAQRARGRRSVSGGVGLDVDRPELLERRRGGRRGRHGSRRRSAGRPGATTRRRGEEQQDAGRERRVHAPPARVFST